MKTYSKIKRDQIKKSFIRTPMHKRISFPDNATDEQYADAGFYLDVIMPDPPFNQDTQYLKGRTSVIVGQTVEHKRIVVNYTQQELDDIAQEKIDQKDINKSLDKLVKAIGIVIFDELRALGSTKTNAQFRTLIMDKFDQIN